MDTKIAGKRTVQCDVSQRSFPKCLSVSAFIAYREQHRHSLDLSWHRGCVLCLALRVGFATGALHSMGQVTSAWTVGQGTAPHLRIPSHFLYESTKTLPECFGDTAISK